MLCHLLSSSGIARLAAVLVSLAGTTSVFAGPMGGASPVNIDPVFFPQGGDPSGGSQSGGYDARVNPTRGVMPNDRVSMTLITYDAQLNSVNVNSLGELRVTRSVGTVNGGANRNGTGNVTFSWDETVSGSRTYIRAMIRTSNNEPFFPATSTVPLPGGGTSPAVYWSWHFGTIDPVNYQSNITNARLVRSSISFSSDGGQSYSGTMNTTSSIDNAPDWRPGSDPGQLMTSVGDGTNMILLQYEVTYVPGAGSTALVGLGCATMFGRRRRR